jgi:serine/threonine-protein kinase
MPPTSATPVQTERRAQFRAFAIDISSGKKAWDINLDAGVLPKRNEAAIPLLAQNTLFIGSSMANLVHAIDPATGKTKWTAATYGPVKGGIVDMQGTLYFGDLRGYLWALNASNGQLVGVKRMGTPFNVGSPIVAGQTLIIGSRGGTLWAVPLSAIRQARDIVTPPPSSSPSPGPHPRPGFRRSRPAASKEFR